LIKRDKNYASWRAANAFSKSGRYTTILPGKEVKRLLKGWGDNYLDNHRKAAVTFGVLPMLGQLTPDPDWQFDPANVTPNSILLRPVSEGLLS
jgi:hypothetical protein